MSIDQIHEALASNHAEPLDQPAMTEAEEQAFIDHFGAPK